MARSKVKVTGRREAPVRTFEALSVQDFEQAARGVLPDAVYEFIAGGAADEITVRWNREAFDHLRLSPRVLADVSRVQTGLSLLGTELPHPILLAPAAYQKLVHPEGELAAARGAASSGAVFVLSSNATVSLEDVARAGGAPLWFQLYVQSDREMNREMIERAAAAGCKALCVTVDTPVLGPRNREQRAGFSLPPGLSLPMNPQNLKARQKSALGSQEAGRRVSVTWKDIEEFRALSTIPVVLKGILHPDDAEQAARIGVSGIIVSNHGGRNLDTALATVDALPRIVDRVGARMPVLVDGGIRRGTDVLKCLGMGASAVLVGRPYLFGLAVSGAAGVARVLEILRHELELAMALTGKARLSDLDRSLFG
jgi:4-hydroxymandelate oxidase